MIQANAGILRTTPRAARSLRPIRAVACPRDLMLVPATKCITCDDRARMKRRHKNFWVYCDYPGGGPEYVALRVEMEGAAR